MILMPTVVLNSIFLLSPREGSTISTRSRSVPEKKSYWKSDWIYKTSFDNFTIRKVNPVDKTSERWNSWNCTIWQNIKGLPSPYKPWRKNSIQKLGDSNGEFSKLLDVLMPTFYAITSGKKNINNVFNFHFRKIQFFE